LYLAASLVQLSKPVKPHAAQWDVAQVVAAMDSSSTTQPCEKTAYQYLESIDFSYLKSYMCSEQYTLPQWNEEDALFAITLYKRYLFLLIKYGKQTTLVPTKEIDEVWHNHILHTKNYHQDCKHLFGRYMHHVPSDLSQEDAEKLAKLFKKTRELYELEFTEPLPYYNHTLESN
jgi:hypothetical protein